METVENQVACIPDEGSRYTVVCPKCGAEWDSRDEHVFSESGHYCIECIKRLDTHANRMLWVECESKQPEVVGYYLGATGWIPAREAACAVYGLMQANLPQFVGGSKAFEDMLHDFVHERHASAFLAWLMEQN